MPLSVRLRTVFPWGLVVRRKLIAGNWKMNGSRQANAGLLADLLPQIEGLAADVAVIPPAVYLQQVQELIADSAVALGAQNLALSTAPGAFTGEVSGDMLKDAGCSLVLIGHSERRALFGETDELVAGKVQAALSTDLTPVICVGESEAEQTAGKTTAVIERQVRAALKDVTAAQAEKIVVAYEPVWAIGTGKTATPEQAQAVHAQIRGLLAELAPGRADGIRILYGGSVNAGNAAELFAQPDIDGGLVGGASLKAQDFAEICKA